LILCPELPTKSFGIIFPLEPRFSVNLPLEGGLANNLFVIRELFTLDWRANLKESRGMTPLIG